MKKQIINTNSAPAPIGPYNQSVKAGPFLFVSGQIPLDMETNEIEKDVVKATHIVMGHIKSILSTSQLDFNDVVKATIFLESMDDFTKVNEVYAEYFDAATAPAREAVAVKTLPKNSPVEISVIAALKG